MRERRNQRFLKKLLIASGLLNILLASGIYYLFAFEPSTALSVVLLSGTHEEGSPLASSFEEMKCLDYDTLLQKLSSKKEIYHNTRERDVSLQVLIENHHWSLPFCRTPHSDKEFGELENFLKNHPWPLTTKGLFTKLKEGVTDPQLQENFLSQKEIRELKSVLRLDEETLLGLLLQGSYEQLESVLALTSTTQKDKRILAFYYSQGIEPKKGTAKYRAKEEDLYIVQAGDSLWKIAKTHQTSVDHLRKINQLTTDSLRPGKVIKISS